MLDEHRLCEYITEWLFLFEGQFLRATALQISEVLLKTEGGEVTLPSEPAALSSKTAQWALAQKHKYNISQLCPSRRTGSSAKHVHSVWIPRTLIVVRVCNTLGVWGCFELLLEIQTIKISFDHSGHALKKSAFSSQFCTTTSQLRHSVASAGPWSYY